MRPRQQRVSWLGSEQYVCMLLCVGGEAASVLVRQLGVGRVRIG